MNAIVSKLFVLCVWIAAFVGALAQTPAGTVQERLGYPATARPLVIHADDLGGSHTINRAIFEALEKGWVTSASILVPCPWFPEVARWAKAYPEADLGIHLALNSEWTEYRWGPVSTKNQVPSLLDSQGYMPLEEGEVVQHAKMSEVERELRAQVDRAREFGIQLTHLDTHMGTLARSPELFGEYLKVGHAYNLPVLLERTPTEPVPPGISIPQDEALTDAVLQMVPGVPIDQWLDWYKKTLTPLKPGAYQLIVHLKLFAQMSRRLQ